MSILLRRTCTLEELPEVIAQVRSIMVDHHILALRGSLGAGKTTLVSGLLRAAGVHEVVTSPTFTYVNVYQNDQGWTFYHFDLYRLTSCDEFIAAGFDEYLGRPNSWVLIEWPDVILPLLNQNVLNITLDYVDAEHREVTLFTDDVIAP